MHPERTRTHLRVVSHRTMKEKNRAFDDNEDSQLSLPYPEVSSIFFLFVQSLKHGEFDNIIKEKLPGWIIDVRVVPRLDTLSRSRKSAFKLFKEAKSSYVDLFGRLEVTSYQSAEANPVFWDEKITTILKNSEQKGPYIFLFDDAELMELSKRVLNTSIKNFAGKNAQIFQIPLKNENSFIRN